ncbi:MAG: hypothetical protein A3F84_25410 [Candidatus Handelsmanbacteria bacterium RIFCSPLOWO2_12_FULL_64_10]|uniref:Uncharacterized protein n=1 Tax=Handelsmanbacteria sp. (strain RIFCSPLOWO2_12_FULL_64_10) TaxID=1817868 RepID=A0A1F6CTP1_HANXR|nr:MAG: hypothetical protein A3F84_25410 [Candidatus Handelsmanbacteria bacterium RIFCSPLOWO2_12_FULL_64_10]
MEVAQEIQRLDNPLANTVVLRKAEPRLLAVSNRLADGHFYLMRQLCWVLTINAVETYILQPRDSAGFEMIADAVQNSVASPNQYLDVVVGVRGPMAPPQMCRGLRLPIVMFDQIISFNREQNIDLLVFLGQGRVPPLVGVTRAHIEEALNRTTQVARNTGASDRHRALNYLAVNNYPEFYLNAADECHGTPPGLPQRDAFLSGVEVRRSRQSGARRIVDVIFAFTDNNTSVVRKFFVRVDVTERFPFLVTPWSPYYDHS